MRKRNKPAVLRLHKYSKDNNPNEYLFSECLLYKPYRNEDEIHFVLKDKSKEELDILVKEIQEVKCQVMEFLENVDEARLMVGEASKNSDIGEDINPEKEQEINDCEIEGLLLHPEFEHLNPDFLKKL